MLLAGEASNEDVEPRCANADQQRPSTQIKGQFSQFFFHFCDPRRPLECLKLSALTARRLSIYGLAFKGDFTLKKRL